MKLTIDEIIKATDATVIRCTNKSGCFNISTDTRTICIDDIYLPLEGENFDGHDFIKQAVEKGARGYFTAKKRIKYSESKLILFVKDTRIAYLNLAKYCREKVNPVVVAITGSSGKTTTKEMVASVLQMAYKIHKSPLNHNNEIGMCQTILSQPKDTEVLILEMGMRGLREIKLLSKYSMPDIAVIVNSGSAHIGRLKTVENIAKAKCEITTKLHPEGVLFAQDSVLIRNANKYKGKTIYLSLKMPEVKILEQTPDSSRFLFNDNEYTLNVGGEHNIQDALYAICVGLKLGMTPEKIAEGLSLYKPIEKRWEIKEIGGYKIINDSYNANPESMKAALTTFLSLYEGEKVVVLGDMGELGENAEKYHINAGKLISRYKDVKVVTVGKLAKFIAENCGHESVSFEDSRPVAKYITDNVAENSLILFKASRSMKFEEIISEIEELKK